jgi:glycosyltransferase involved in cell wall biosynthesis
MKIIIIASDIHSGGGKIVLNELLSSALKMDSINFYVMVDSRFDKDPYFAKNIFFTTISKFQRVFYVNRMVGNLATQNDIIINISDLPIFLSYKGTKVQYLMNRFFIDNYSTKGLTILTRLKLFFEKISFSVYLKKADYVFVQNTVMKDLLLKLGYCENNIRVIPFKNIDQIIFEGKKIKDSFIYVASGEAHKNHLNLLSAWAILAEEGIYPTLFLTIDDSSSLSSEIIEKVQKNNLKIFIKPNLPRDELLSYYQSVSALIYPSFFECFGIPIVEASNYNLPIIASELDYVRDLIDPVETFDPESARSIARAVKRFIGRKENRSEVLSTDEFTKELISYAKPLEK